MVSQFYDGLLRRSGVRMNQFTLLQALTLAPGISQKQLAELLGIDSTTLTRTLAHLRGRRWLRSEPGADRREVRLFLTAAGRQEYKRALPYWRAAQKRLKQAWGRATWNEVTDSAVRAAGVTPKPD